jgi:hypothetical protein
MTCTPRSGAGSRPPCTPIRSPTSGTQSRLPGSSERTTDTTWTWSTHRSIAPRHHAEQRPAPRLSRGSGRHRARLSRLRATTLPTASAASTTTTDASAAAPKMAVPVPGISVAIAGGGHPDLIGTLSSALIARFRVSEIPILALPFGLLAQPIVVATPQATAEPFVLPATVLEPIPEPTALIGADVASAPISEDAAPTTLTHDVPPAQITLNFEPFLTARAGAQAELPAAASNDTAAVFLRLTLLLIHKTRLRPLCSPRQRRHPCKQRRAP